MLMAQSYPPILELGRHNYLHHFLNKIIGKTLKFKDMIEVKFTLLDKADADNDGQKLIAKEERYKVRL